VPGEAAIQALPDRRRHRLSCRHPARLTPALPEGRARQGREALLRQDVIDNVESSCRPVKGFRRAR